MEDDNDYSQILRSLLLHGKLDKSTHYGTYEPELNVVSLICKTLGVEKPRKISKHEHLIKKEPIQDKESLMPSNEELLKMRQTSKVLYQLRKNK